MEHYVTLFDGMFLPQGLALHASMERHAGAYTLWVLCMDDTALAVLRRLNLPHLRTIDLAEVETEALRSVKHERSRGEYCWTITPFAPKFVFDREPLAGRVTYVDADTWLCADPRPLFAGFEVSGKAVQITEHASAPEFDQTLSAGRYCVQFVTFVRDAGEDVRTWWAERCIEWCYARWEDGRFGDQKYLDDWPLRFPDKVHVLAQKSLTQAPWNNTRFPPSEAALFHFHGLRLLRGGKVLLTDRYPIPRPTRTMFHEPYLLDLKAAVARLGAAGHAPPAQIDTPVMLLRVRLAWLRLRLWLRDRFAPRVAAL